VQRYDYGGSFSLAGSQAGAQSAKQSIENHKTAILVHILLHCPTMKANWGRYFGWVGVLIVTGATIGCAPAPSDEVNAAEGAIVNTKTCELNSIIDNRLWEWQIDARVTASELLIRSAKVAPGDIEVWARYSDDTVYQIEVPDRVDTRAERADRWYVLPVGIRPGATYSVRVKLRAPIADGICKLDLST